MTLHRFTAILLELGFSVKGAKALWKNLPKFMDPAKMRPDIVRMTAADFKINRFRLGIDPSWFVDVRQPGLCSACAHPDHGEDYCGARGVNGRCGCRGNLSRKGLN
jgi:hypothetical protein